MKTKHTAALAAAFAIATTAASQGAIVLSGNFNTGTPTPTLTITQDITFNISVGGFPRILVFDEWTTSDGSQSFVFPTVGQQFAYSLNGAPANNSFSMPDAGLGDNLTSDARAITTKDGRLFFNSFLANVGDTVVVSAGSYTFGSDPQFNPLLSTTDSIFTGETFLTDISGNRLTDNVSLVPESSALALTALASLSLLRRKRRASV